MSKEDYQDIKEGIRFLIKPIKESNYKELIIFLLISPFFFIITYYLFEYKYTKYQRLGYYDEFKHKVVNFEWRKGAIYFDLSENNKISITHSEGIINCKLYFDDVIQIGDSIIKDAKSDTICIKRGNQKYYFLMLLYPRESLKRLMTDKSIPETVRKRNLKILLYRIKVLKQTYLLRNDI